MPVTEEMRLAEQRELRDQCTVFLAGHGPVTAAGLLADIPTDTVTDRYGSGGVVAELEIEVGGLLGKPAAVFLPSGTMAQQCLRPAGPDVAPGAQALVDSSPPW